MYSQLSSISAVGIQALLFFAGVSGNAFAFLGKLYFSELLDIPLSHV